MKKRIIQAQELQRLYPAMDPAFEQRMLRTIHALPQQREESAVKRKLSVGLVLAIVLIVATAATALAFTISRRFFEDVARLQLESGYYNAWSLEEKVEVLDMMVENGIVAAEGDVQAILEGDMDDDAREAALDALMLERYGGGVTEPWMLENIGIESILTTEMGPQTEWTLEEKAWYTGMMLELGLLGYDTDLYLLPGEDVISPEEAEQAARTAAAEAFGVDPAEMDAYDALIDYGVYRAEAEYKDPYYTVYFVTRDEDGEIADYAYDYTCYVAGDGRILSSADGYRFITSPQENADAQRAQAEAEQVGGEAFLDEHRAQLEALEAALHPIDGAYLPEGSMALKDGTLLHYGRLHGDNDSQSSDDPVLYATCVDAQGAERWSLTLPEEGAAVDGAVQLEGGDILLYVSADTLTCGPYRQVRLSAQGEVLETLSLPTTLEMSGVQPEDEDQNFPYTGHEGFLLMTALGQTNTPFFAQLDAAGQVVWAHTYEAFAGCAVRLYPTQEGYIARGRSGNLPVVWTLDMQGNITGQASLAGLEGMTLGTPLQQADGSFLAAGIGEDETVCLVAFEADGTVLWTSERVQTALALSVTAPIPSGDGFVFAARHDVNAYTPSRHLGVFFCDADGGLTERYPQGADGQDMMGVWQLLPVGSDGQAAVVSWGYDSDAGDQRVTSLLVMDL